MNKENKYSLSRRDFLKMGLVGVSSIYILGNNTQAVSALSDKYIESNRTKFSKPKSYIYIDSVGRRVRLPEKISTVVPLGHMAQDMLYNLCANKMISVAELPERGEEDQYVLTNNHHIKDLPETGKLYYKNDSRNIKTDKIESLNSNVIIDVGFLKDDLVFSLDYIQEKTGSPVIFVDASLGKLPEAYRTLGKILDCSERAEELALFIEDIKKNITINKKSSKGIRRVYYAKNNGGRCPNAGYSIQNEVLKSIGLIPVTFSEFNKENLIDFKNIKQEEIDFIIFNDIKVFDNILSNKNEEGDKWKSIKAINSGKFALSPGVIHNWIAFPLFAQIIGRLWISYILGTGCCEDILIEKVKNFYELFYSYKINDEEIKKILHGATIGE